jgi:hypothetical protein
MHELIDHLHDLNARIRFRLECELRGYFFMKDPSLVAQRPQWSHDEQKANTTIDFLEIEPRFYCIFPARLDSLNPHGTGMWIAS